MYSRNPCASLLAAVPMLWLWAAPSIGGAAEAVAMPEGLPALTRVEQVRELTAAEASRGYSVKLLGVVTLWDARQGFLFIQDETGGILATPQDKTQIFRVGQEVEVTGLAAPGSHLPYVNQALVQGLGAAPLPVAKRRTFTQLAADEDDCNWVEVRGVVRAGAIRDERPILEIAAEGKRLRVVFSSAPTSRIDIGAMVDAEVRVQGVCGMVSRQPNDPILLELHVPSAANLVVEVKAPEKPYTLPLRPIADIISSIDLPALVHRVRLKGALETAPDGSLIIRDNTSMVRVQTAKSIVLESSQQAEVLGFPAREAGVPVLEDATVRLFALGLAQVSNNATNGASAPSR